MRSNLKLVSPESFSLMAKIHSRLIHKQKTTSHLVYLFGGLGNCLFQLNYASNLCASGLYVYINTDLISSHHIIRLLGWTDHHSLRDLSVLGALLPFKIKNKNYITTCRRLLSSYLVAKIRRKQFPCLSVSTEAHSLSSFGYYQLDNHPNPSFLAHLRFSLSQYVAHKSRLRNIIDCINSLDAAAVVHVRGGDFLNQRSIPILPVAYYANALQGLKKAFIVTNDITYANLLFEKIKIDYTIIPPQSPVSDFALLQSSRYKVIANSTFSWWASELSCEGSTIIQPQYCLHSTQSNPISNHARQFVNYI